MLTWVYLTNSTELDPEKLVLTHIERMNDIGFDAAMCKQILNSISSLDQLKLKYLSSLAYVKLINSETALKGPEVDLIELANILMDHYEFIEKDEVLFREYLSALYYRVIIPYTSLFFFRSRHLLPTLEILVNDVTYRREKAFWQKSEDLILRVKTQLSSEELAHVVQIYSKVPVSQVFWTDMENLILSKSADFKG